METRQVLFFCDAVHPGTCWRCMNGCVSRTNSETRNLLLQMTTLAINIIEARDRDVDIIDMLSVATNIGFFLYLQI